MALKNFYIQEMLALSGIFVDEDLPEHKELKKFPEFGLFISHIKDHCSVLEELVPVLEDSIFVSLCELEIKFVTIHDDFFKEIDCYVRDRVEIFAEVREGELAELHDELMSDDLYEKDLSVAQPIFGAELELIRHRKSRMSDTSIKLIRSLSPLSHVTLADFLNSAEDAAVKLKEIHNRIANFFELRKGIPSFEEFFYYRNKWLDTVHLFLEICRLMDEDDPTIPDVARNYVAKLRRAEAKVDKRASMLKYKKDQRLDMC